MNCVNATSLLRLLCDIACTSGETHKFITIYESLVDETVSCDFAMIQQKKRHFFCFFSLIALGLTFHHKLYMMLMSIAMHKAIQWERKL